MDVIVERKEVNNEIRFLFSQHRMLSGSSTHSPSISNKEIGICGDVVFLGAVLSMQFSHGKKTPKMNWLGRKVFF